MLVRSLVIGEALWRQTTLFLDCILVLVLDMFLQLITSSENALKGIKAFFELTELLISAKLATINVKNVPTLPGM